MRLPRNPFRSNKVENLESHDLFLKLFQPLAIGALADNPWDSVQLIRSAQGGGKTSLMRVFTPECLRRVASTGTSSYLAEIAEALKDVGALTDEGPTVLGLYLPFGSTPYATLARLELGAQNPLHLFYALLDARIVLTALRGALSLHGLHGDHEIDRITLSWPQQDANPICQFDSARGLFEWAKKTERDIWRAVDRGTPGTVAELGHSKPYALEAFSRESISIDRTPVCQRVLIMIDDAHKLATDQRRCLLEHVITSRLNVSFWVAERMYAMEPYELLALDTASTAREYKPIILSMWWQKASDASYSRFYNELATKRMEEVGVEAPFDQIAVATFGRRDNIGAISKAYSDLCVKLSSLQEADPRLSDIIIPPPKPTATMQDLVNLKALDMYIASNIPKEQQSLGFEGEILNPSPSELLQYRSAAEYQVCELNSLPLYYGASNMYRLASWNVDQFLLIAGGLFAQLDAQRVRGAEQTISPTVQHQIIESLANEYWAGIPKRMQDGDVMQRFLQNFAKYARTESLGPTAKYPPGVTGFGISSYDHERLRNSSHEKEPHLCALATLLSNAVASNVIFMKADAKQGRKGETVTVFYLNRLLCAYFGLPVGLGGWWKRKVDHFATLLKNERMPADESSTPSLFEVAEN